MVLCRNVNLRLQIYVLRNILPQYKKLDAAHNKMHIQYVIRRSLAIAKEYNADANMVYCIAAFHDIGMLEGREQHEVWGAEKINADKVITHLFSSKQMELMKAAIREHRASYIGTYTSIYSRIISQADRSFDIFFMTKRSIKYGKRYFPDYSYEQHYNRTYKYLKKKYGREGYTQMVLEYLPDEKKIDKIQNILDDEKQFRIVFDKCYSAANKSGL